MLEGILEGRREKESVDDSGRKGSDLKWTQKHPKTLIKEASKLDMQFEKHGSLVIP